MYAKIYEQIFDSTLAENYQVRHVFEDLLKLADQDGVVDRTREAIARRTNVPLEIVRMAIGELEKPDLDSRSKKHDGRRIIPLEEHRGWGWQIVNHGYYRKLKTADEMRESAKERMRKLRYDNGKPTKSEQNEQNVTSAYAYVSVPGGCKGGGFKEPTIEEVRLLFAKAGGTDRQADKFFNFYASKGWLVGKTKMKSVTHAVAGWILRNQENAPVNTNPTNYL